MSARALLRRQTFSSTTRIIRSHPFSTQTALRQTAPGAPVATATATKKGVGAVKGSLFGFLFGSTVAGGLSYFYLLEEYRVANELLTEDVDALRASVLRVEAYVRSVEDKLAQQQQQQGGQVAKRW